MSDARSSNCATSPSAIVGVTAVKDLSLALSPGEVLCLLGENGAGKSTVIKMLTGVETPTSGEVLIDGKPVHFASPRDAREQGIATVYQEVGTLAADERRAQLRARRGADRRAAACSAASISRKPSRIALQEPARTRHQPRHGRRAACRHAVRRRTPGAGHRPRACISARACWCSTSRPRRWACANRRPCCA